MTLLKSEKDSAQKAAQTLLQGKIAVLPTDTVYGFSALAILDKKKSGLDLQIDKIKESPSSKPLIELISRPKDIFRYTDQEIPQKVFEKWPGPLTVIVQNNEWYKDLTGREKTAFRCPGDEWLREVISLCESPIYSTSVNLSGKAVLESEAAIWGEFGGQIDLFVKDGDKKNALPSTIVAIEDGKPCLVRQGAVKID